VIQSLLVRLGYIKHYYGTQMLKDKIVRANPHLADDPAEAKRFLREPVVSGWDYDLARPLFVVNRWGGLRPYAQ
tara:strand:- start:41552 stop:41773 length:222 start_codon:yes stop_codon:yes gene_type:complete